MPHFIYASIRTLRLLPFLGYWEQGCNKQGNADVSLTHWFHFLAYVSRNGIAEAYDSLNYFQSIHTVFHNSCTNLIYISQCLYQFTSHNACTDLHSIIATLIYITPTVYILTSTIFSLLDNSHFYQNEVISHAVLICISLKSA